MRSKNTLVKYLRRHGLDLGLWLLFVVSLALMVKSSSDPMPDFVARLPWLEALLLNFATGNQIIFDIFVGVVVSQFMYVLVVRLPAWQRKKRLQAHLLRRYDELKTECMMHFVNACGLPANAQLHYDLKEFARFKAFFEERVTEDQTRWDQVKIGLTEQHIRMIVRALDMFRADVEYTLTVVDVADEFVFMRNLTKQLQRWHVLKEDGEGTAAFAWFMWTLFSGWRPMMDYTNKDSIIESIQAM